MDKKKIWYTRYADLAKKIKEKRRYFWHRCEELGVVPSNALKEIWIELIARATKESNWQEGLKLSEPKTRELANESYNDFDNITEPHLDMHSIIKQHKKNLRRLKQESKSLEEIGAYNLSLAYNMIPFVGRELIYRFRLMIYLPLKYIYLVHLGEDHVLKKLYGTGRWNIDEKDIKNIEKATKKLNLHADSNFNSKAKILPGQPIKSLEQLFEMFESFMNSSECIPFPVSGGIEKISDYYKELNAIDMKSIMNPFKMAYLHFFHKITLMAISPENVIGRFRKVSVHIGDPSVMFPAPSLISGLMKEYCSSFPPMAPEIEEHIEPIMLAAEQSHRFVAIHPYRDGNGRISRLIMNLILWCYGYPPIYLKADKKGRSRYSKALKRANNGNYVALASLIAISLDDVYDKLIKTVES